MSDLAAFRDTLAGDRHLGVLVTTHPDRRDPQVAVVNVGIVDHPTTGDAAVAFVARRGAKLTNLRAHPAATIVARSGWEWVAVRGPVELSGPDDHDLDLVDRSRRRLFQDIYHAAGGDHPDLDRYWDVMVAERRCAVLLRPQHVWSNPPGSEHREPTDALEVSS